MPLQIQYANIPGKSKDIFSKTQKGFNPVQNDLPTSSPINPVAKSDILKKPLKRQEDNILPYKEKQSAQDQKIFLLDMWICSNCNSVNKATEYKCRSCKLINSKQREIIEQANSNQQIINKSTDNVKTIHYNNINASYKKINCLCYSNCKDNLVQNGICTLCGREVDLKKQITQQKKIILEKEILYNNQKGYRAKSKETSPEYKSTKKNSNDNNSYQGNVKKGLAMNRYDEQDDYQVLNSNHMIKGIRITKEHGRDVNSGKNRNTFIGNNNNNGYMKKKMTEFVSKKK